MIPGILLAVLSALFFVLWQYWESPWLILGYLIAAACVTVWLVRKERRKTQRILDRMEAILESGTGEFVAEEGMSAAERKLILRLCQLEAREARVQDGYRRISSLVADIAHQSKTPLSSILMYTEMSENGEVIRSQTEKLAFLMESLTKLAKCEGGLIAENLRPSVQSVKELLRMVIESGYAAADEKNMEIRCDVPDDLTASFDLRWTAEAVGNILDNAVKYSPENSTVTIIAREWDNFVRIDISDCGCGIPEDELCSIWNRFCRGRNASDKNGVGIGLYLTANILNTEGGRVSAKSDENGSTFTVFLPAV